MGANAAARQHGRHGAVHHDDLMRTRFCQSQHRRPRRPARADDPAAPAGRIEAAVSQIVQQAVPVIALRHDRALVEPEGVRGAEPSHLARTAGGKSGGGILVRHRDRQATQAEGRRPGDGPVERAGRHFEGQ